MPSLRRSGTGYRKEPTGIYKVPVLSFSGEEILVWVTIRSADAMVTAELAVVAMEQPYEIQLNAERQTYSWTPSTITIGDIYAFVGLLGDRNEQMAARQKVEAWSATADVRAPQILRRRIYGA